MRFENTVVVVTGAGSGIGKATARTFASLGAVVVGADINRPAVDATAAEAAVDGLTIHAQTVDVTLPDSIEALVSYVTETHGPAGVLANVAGWDIIQQFMDNDPDYWARVVDLNLMGPIRMTRAFLPGMIEAGGGAVVNVASDAGRVGSTGETVYAGAKGGVIAFTKSLAREMARHQVRVNCICPGPTDTPLFHSQSEGMKAALIRAIPLKRLADPSEIADAIAFFASRRASFITGQVLSVSGGLTMAG